MDENGILFQLGYNRLDFFLSPSEIQKILQLQNQQNEKTINLNLNPALSPPTEFHPESPNNRVVFPMFFHPSEDDVGELAHPSPSNNNDDVIRQTASHPLENPEPSPLSPLINSLSEIIIKSSADAFSTTTKLFETSTTTSSLAMNNTNIANTRGGGGGVIFSDEVNNELLNNDSSYSSSPMAFPSWNSTGGSNWASEEIGAVFIICLMIPFIICSNLLVILSVIRFRRLHTPTNYFITSLAAVDIIVGLITPLVIAVQIFKHGENNEDTSDTLVCILPNRILMMSCGVSLLNLATIAYDRHTALICPLEYVNIMTSRKVAVLMVCSWIYSGFVVWLPLILGWYDASFPSSQCTVDHLHQKAHILFITAIFVPSCTVILICYSRIFMLARHHAKSIAAVEFAVHRRLQVRFMIKDTKYAKTLALVIGGFLALWLPYLVCTFMKTISGVSVNVWLETYLILLAVLNSGINPWIYAFKNNEFQAAFKRMAREHCGSQICLRDSRRSSLVSGLSTTSRLSRTNSRMAGTFLDATTNYGLTEKIHKSLGFMNSIDSELSDYTATSSQNNTDCVKEDSSHSSSKYLCPGLMPTTCVIANETEHQYNNTGDFSLKEKENAANSSKDRGLGEDNPVYIKDEISYNTFQSVVFNVRQVTKDHLYQIKKIKNKGTNIIRSASTLSSFSSIKPQVVRHNNKGGHQSPIRRIKNKGSAIIRSSSALSSLSSSIRPQFKKDRLNQLKSTKNNGSSNIIRSASALSFIPSVRHHRQENKNDPNENKTKTTAPSSNIMRSTSALPSVRPLNLLPSRRRPSASLPSSPIQTHTPPPPPPTKSLRKPGDSTPRPPRLPRFHSFCHQPPPTPQRSAFNPMTAPIYPTITPHQYFYSPVLPRTQFATYSPQTPQTSSNSESFYSWVKPSGGDNHSNVFHH